jgi:hypothetical protein
MSFRNSDHDNLGFLDRPVGGKGEFSSLVPRLGVTYAWDMYHQDPTRQRDVSITEVWLEIRGDPHEAEQVLREHFGAPRTIMENTTAYAGFHPFYLQLGSADKGTFRLSWYAEMPRFAIPEPDPAKRAAWLRTFEHRLATAKSVDEVAAFCKTAPPDAGIKITGTLNTDANPYGLPANDGRDYWIQFVPPVSATVLADAFHWTPAVGVTHDVHHSSWHLERRDDTWLPITGADSQWQVEAALTASPRDTSTRARSPSFGGYAIGEHDEVGALAVQPRFK